MTEEHAVAYLRLRERVCGLVRDVDPSALDRPAPATPEWTARDVVAHLAGVADDIVNNRRDGIASDAWTAAQVERRRSMTIAELLNDWDEWGPEFERALAAGPMPVVGQAVFDAVTHEHDLRHAIDRPGARDSDALDRGWEWYFAVRTAGGAPAIRFVTERGAEVAGTGEPVVTIGASRFELLRAMTGRRTVAEIDGYAWDPAPDAPLLLAAPFFTIRTESLGE